MIQRLIEELTILHGRIKRGRTVNVNDRDTKSAVMTLATRYFEDVRASLVDTLDEQELIRSLDDNWQTLVRLAHGNNKRSSYVREMADLSKALKQASVAMLSKAVDPTGSGVESKLSTAEQQLIATLEDLLPTAAASYRQGLLDLHGTTRLSYRGTASEFREALRETLDHLAPDVDVESQPGFRFDGDRKTPTMKQKVRFVMRLRGRSSGQVAVTEKSVSGVEDLTGDVLRATYDRASLATHLETTRAEVLRIKRYVDTVMFDLLEIAE